MSIMSKHLWFSALVMPIAIFNGANAQEHAFGFGRTATKDEIVRADIDVRYDGLGLPVGQGTATEGKQTYYAKCVACHGAALEGNKQVPGKPLCKGVTHSLHQESDDEFVKLILAKEVLRAKKLFPLIFSHGWETTGRKGRPVLGNFKF